jgi:D-lactate dehydrogenase
VYFPTCTGAMFGAEGTGPGVQAAVEELCRKAGVSLRVPDGVDGLCCGTPWRSKGLSGGYDVMRQQVVPALRTATEDGRLPVVCDAASCTEGLARMLAERAPDLRVMDSVSFARTELLPRLPAPRREGTLVLHPTCASAQLGLDEDLRAVAEAVADEVVVPLAWGCCGFAGDRGLLHPELTASATQAEAAEVRATAATEYASCNRTCEVAMTRATGFGYQHVLEIVAARTR